MVIFDMFFFMYSMYLPVMRNIKVTELPDGREDPSFGTLFGFLCQALSTAWQIMSVWLQWEHVHEIIVQFAHYNVTNVLVIKVEISNSKKQLQLGPFDTQWHWTLMVKVNAYINVHLRPLIFVFIVKCFALPY